MGQACHTEECCGNKETTEVDERLMVPWVSVQVVGLVGWPEDMWYPAVGRSLFCTASESPGGEVLLSTQSAKNLAEPLWNEEFSVSAWPGLLEFRLWEEGVDRRVRLLGKAFLDLVDVPDPYVFRTELLLALEAGAGNLGCRLVVKVRPEDGKFPVDDPTCFAAIVDNPRKKALGLEVDPHDGTSLYVTGVKADSIVQTYNKGVSSDLEVTEGCFIVGVNGVSGKSVDLDKALKKSAKLTRAELVVCPAKGFHVAFALDFNGSLGMSFPKRSMGRSVLISNIIPGSPLDNWNAECPEQAVVKGDRIVAVNGKCGKAADLLKMIDGMNRESQVVLSFVRRATDSTSVPETFQGSLEIEDKSRIADLEEGGFEG
mmetsp:Transcript_124303/g.247793  ORF Transcript_124303/g.247793 Transcript_124303/m.247793 type:complete len:372 (-) Transcript_124303:71-1186(-)|eukprot:CAMPEP_0172716350 /NCGR_PEP_ID=MMETSP1074-20121228/68122_1 /TAXON_ID=2916 /ORGANISM="Ceratium fusus, Strain PA161109" /LENGTH=371 /DNA_ID=CAMNT_0013541021 /DNA_START=100 /DNA_END=1215 /DNA_ORIENTATION=-